MLISNSLKILDGKSEDYVSDYNAFATENKGIFRIGSVDCGDFESLCTKEGITAFPTFKVYPPFPIPVFDVDIDDKFDTSKLKKAAGKFYSDKSIEITSNNHKTFVEEDVGTPKVLLFTSSKKGTPFVYKALSQNFEVSILIIRHNLFCFLENSLIRSRQRSRGRTCEKVQS